MWERGADVIHVGGNPKAFLILFQLVKLSLRNTTQFEEGTNDHASYPFLLLPVHVGGNRGEQFFKVVGTLCHFIRSTFGHTVELAGQASRGGVRAAFDLSTLNGG